MPERSFCDQISWTQYNPFRYLTYDDFTWLWNFTWIHFREL